MGYGYSAFSSLGRYLEMELLDHMVVLCLLFREIAILFSTVAVSFYIPTNSAQSFPFLHILANTLLLFLNNSYPKRCEVVSRGFDFHLPND